MEEAFMAEACDSEYFGTQIDNQKASGSAMPFFPWFEALRFSLRVMRKSFFKLFIPSMALSFVMGALLALIAFDDDPVHLFIHLDNQDFHNKFKENDSKD